MHQQHPLQILLIEHHDQIAEAIARLLSADGHMVSRAVTLAEAHQLCEDGKFDLLIASHQLPDGPACGLLAKTSACQSVPGILVGEKDDKPCGASRGFGARLHTPVTLPALRHAIIQATSH